MKNTKLHEKREYLNIRDLVESSGMEYADRTAFSYRVKPRDEEICKVSFAELRDDVRALATEFLSIGCAGKHCAVIGKPSYEWALTYFSILSIGGVVVPLDRDWTASDLADTADNAGAEFLFCEAELADKAKVVAEKISLNHETIYFGGSDEIGVTLSSLTSSGRAKFELSSAEYYSAPIDPLKLAVLVFTSGTTGKGKGVMLSQNAILSDLCAIIPYIDFSDKTVSVLPWHHTYGSSVMLVGHSIIGAEIYISSGLKYIQRELTEQKPGHMVMVPLYLETFYRKIMAKIKETGKEKILKGLITTSNVVRKVGIDVRSNLFSSIRAAFGGNLKMIISGGAPINPEIIHFYESIGLSVLNGYGITECAPIVAVNHSKNVVKNSVGNVIDLNHVKLADVNEDGEGEILVKGPNVMLGYYNDNSSTEDAFDDDGYFRTGDYGKLTKDNVLYITGRKKNLIILSNGKNVYPEEIENDLVSVPGIQTIIVYEGQSARGVEHNAIVAEIFPDKEFMEKNGILDAKAYFKPFIDEYNKSAVAYKKIQILKVRDTEFPTNTLRKVLRYKIDKTID